MPSVPWRAQRIVRTNLALCFPELDARQRAVLRRRHFCALAQVALSQGIPLWASRRRLARLVRSAAIPALENVALWHERDISHSSVERGIGPDATVHLDFALKRLAGVIDKLLVYPENMQRNLDRLGGLVHSQRILLALTQKGMSREASYAAVQRNAMPVWRGEGNFLDLLKKDKEVSAHLKPAELEALFDLGYHTKHVDTIFKRVFS